MFVNLSELRGWVREILRESKILEKIGSGGSRDVFLLDTGKVMKVARSRFGFEQNRNEARISRSGKWNELIPRVTEAGPKYEWIVVEKVTPFGGKGDFENSVGLPWDQFILAIRGRSSELSKKGIVQKFRNLILSTRLNSAELLSPSSWGISNDGRLVIVDYGFVLGR